VQLYTGLIYRGPSLISECARALAVVPDSAQAN
jgi:dihydroorotate dehydrogenase